MKQNIAQTKKTQGENGQTKKHVDENPRTKKMKTKTRQTKNVRCKISKIKMFGMQAFFIVKMRRLLIMRTYLFYYG